MEDEGEGGGGRRDDSTSEKYLLSITILPGS